MLSFLIARPGPSENEVVYFSLGPGRAKITYGRIRKPLVGDGGPQGGPNISIDLLKILRCTDDFLNFTFQNIEKPKVY